MRSKSAVVVRVLLGGLLAAVVTPGLLAQSADITRTRKYELGTSIEVQAWGGTPADRAAGIEEAFAAFAEVDRLMSNYRDDSELAHVNRNAARGPVRVSEPLFRVLEAANLISRQSSGAFDVTVGPLVALWGFHDRKARIPTDQELSAIRPIIGYQNIVLDEQARTVRFLRPGVEIDLGGIGKGFAVELAAAALRAHGLGGAIDAGGNQYLLGQPPGKHNWVVGIRDPTASDGLLGTLTLSEGAVSTSATYGNFLTLNGRTYGHILDPHELKPSDASLSVTIWSADGTLSDALSKAAFVLGPERGLSVVDAMPRTMGLIVYRDANGRVAIVMSPGLRGRFHRVSQSPDE
jgi:thiamine biosynthesis lipoprotein ApbE